MYKKNQGVIAKVSLLVTISLLLLYVSNGIYEYFILRELIEVVGLKLTLGHILGTVFFLVTFPLTGYLLFYNKKVVDFLVEVEGELRKVTWPEYKPFSIRTELWRSSFVVITAMVVISVCVFIMDLIWQYILLPVIL